MRKFVFDLRQVGGFLGTQASANNKTDSNDIAEILLDMALTIIALTLHPVLILAGNHVSWYTSIF